jgi:hypothetical protein
MAQPPIPNEMFTFGKCLLSATNGRTVFARGAVTAIKQSRLIATRNTAGRKDDGPVLSPRPLLYRYSVHVQLVQSTPVSECLCTE